MTDLALDTARFSWEEAGKNAAALADGKHAIVVTGENVEAAAAVALGIGAVQARARRAAIADLVAFATPLARLLPREVVHGLVDHFQFGVSLGRVAVPIGLAGNLLLLPSGAAPGELESVVRHPEWSRLIEAFRASDSLLLIVAPPSAPGVEELIALSDGAIIAGSMERRPRDATIGTVTLTESHPRMPTAPLVAQPMTDLVDDRRGKRRLYGVLAAVSLLVVALIALGAWYMSRSGRDPSAVADSTSRSAVVPPATAGGVAAASAPAQSTPGTSAASSPAPGDSTLRVANLEDSLRAASYAVVIASFTSQNGAIAEVDRRFDVLPAMTYAPVLLPPDNSRWYRVMVGAFRESREADSLMARLHRAGSDSAAQLVHVPFALRVRTGVARKDAPGEVRAYQLRQLPVYALLQADNSVTLYAGAFERPEDAALLIAAFRENGEQPPVAYRTGRVF
jgi:hypothetical protein